ncbi:hypothetical protein H2199_001258 [Coniosporium tulheliwenetii]|uniref:Uncharacterized protein n=1 Tax=Coniosporium tulheliwenetii TaxID=3383036 RepID=A0ACC2ZLC2_9PEZI|nr:hypothetical protein H2199_001258 [Cladosporium sp. JES 115]
MLPPSDHLRRLVVPFLSLVSIALAQYALVDEYLPTNFFDKFNFYTGPDPTWGHVHYKNRSYAQDNGLINTYSDHIRLGVDTTNRWPIGGQGRPSVRISTNATYQHGLFIADIRHMPFGCGTWPAYWMLGQGLENWPAYGEIDIIEGANLQDKNRMTLHTSNNCTIAGNNQNSELVTPNCWSQAGGCGVRARTTDTYGAGFNTVGGGVYAMEWTSSWIRIWFFPRNSIPAGVSSSTPDPSTFGVPLANFQGPSTCNIDSKFVNHKIIFNIDFCGQWAGNAYASSGCPLTANQTGWDSCVYFVGDNPSNFTEAYWSINSLRVYQIPGTPYSSSALPTSVSTSSALASTASEPVALGSSASVSTTSTVSGMPTAAVAGCNLTCPAANFTDYRATNHTYTIICRRQASGQGMFMLYDVNTMNDCIARCDATANCEGALYIPANKACYMVSRMAVQINDNADDRHGFGYCCGLPKLVLIDSSDIYLIFSYSSNLYHLNNSFGFRFDLQLRLIDD